jgi:sporulation protein YlmC with PRC-barrel domain
MIGDPGTMAIIAEIAGWIAPVATAMAAVMTAINLGARVTGWGFVVFLIGSLAWSAVGATTGQTNLLLTNAFLTAVNLVGIWRWLGRQARYEKHAEAAVAASEARPAPDLRTLSSLIGTKVVDNRAAELGEIVEALLECGTGKLDHIIVRSGGVAGLGEKLSAVAAGDVMIESDRVVLGLDERAFDALPPWEPVRPPADAVQGRTDAVAA